MPSIIDETLFSEPSGRPFAVLQFCGALFFSGLYVYTVVVENSPMGNWPLFIAAGCTFSGIAESLPKTRRQAAGVLRLAGILALSCLLVAIFFAPRVVVK